MYKITQHDGEGKLLASIVDCNTQKEVSASLRLAIQACKLDDEPRAFVRRTIVNFKRNGRDYTLRAGQWLIWESLGFKPGDLALLVPVEPKPRDIRPEKGTGRRTR